MSGGEEENVTIVHVMPSALDAHRMILNFRGPHSRLIRDLLRANAPLYMRLAIYESFIVKARSLGIESAMGEYERNLGLLREVDEFVNTVLDAADNDELSDESDEIVHTVLDAADISEDGEGGGGQGGGEGGDEAEEAVPVEAVPTLPNMEIFEPQMLQFMERVEASAMYLYLTINSMER